MSDSFAAVYRRLLTALLLASGLGAALILAPSVGARVPGGGRSLTPGGDCALPEPFPACGGSDLRVKKRETQTLAPGTHGKVTVQNGATLILEEGDHAFCQLRVSRNSRLLFRGPTTVAVDGRITFSNLSRVEPEESSGDPCDLELFTRGDQVVIQRRAQVSGILCAPQAEMFVANGVRLTGEFVAKTIHQGRRVVVQDCPGAPTTTTQPGATTTTTTTLPGATTTTVPGTTTTTPGATTTTLPGGTTTTLPSVTTTTLPGTTTTLPGTTTTLPGATTTTTLPGVCDCCTSTRLQFTTGAPQIGVPPGCGSLSPAGTALDCGGLYFGGAGVAVPLPSVVPDQGSSITKVEGCTAGSFTLAATTAAESGSARNCTSAGETNGYPRPGCLFGPPLPVPNANTPATSTCVINRITTSATGSGSCAGESSINFDLGSDLYLTGDLLVGVAGIQPCPICSGTCQGGPNEGATCTPATGNLGEAYPTTHDCPPPEPSFIGTLPIPFALTTGSASKTAAAAGTQTLVFCGFCRSSVAPNPFENPAHPCTSDAECTTAPFTRCEQRNEGAFGDGTATTITETGSPSACLADGAPHDATLVSVFCIPPSFNGLVDGAADLPGPGAVALPGVAQVLP